MRIWFPLPSKVIGLAHHYKFVSYGVGNVDAFTLHVTNTFPQLITGLFSAEKALSGKAPFLLHVMAVLPVPSVHTLDLISLSLANVSILTLGSSCRGNTTVRDGASGTHMLDDDNVR